MASAATIARGSITSFDLVFAFPSLEKVLQAAELWQGTLRMFVHRLASGVVAQAPAKLNLFFEVRGKRTDGFHEIETLMLPVTLYDTLSFASDDSDRIACECRWAALDQSAAVRDLGVLPAPEDNLATKAARLLRERAGVRKGGRLSIVKRIPAAAGLGGGSSDAAAALAAANVAWGLDWPRDRLAALAAELGSDVPFFLAGGPAICRGRGEQVEAVSGLGSIHCVVVRPPEGLSTAEVYAQSTPAREPRSAAPLVEALRRGDWHQLASAMLNRLETAASRLSPWVSQLAQEFRQLGCLASQLSGSGTSYFGICHSARHARWLAARLRARRLGYGFAVQSY